MEDLSSIRLMTAESPSEESLLLDRLRSIEANRTGTYVVHLHLSGLRPASRKPHYVRIAARAFEALVDNFDATLYQLSNADFVLFCRDVPVEEVDPVLFKVRTLFGDDPLTLGDEGSLEDRFTSWYDLSAEEDYAAFIDVAADLLVAFEQRVAREIEERAAEPVPVMEGEPLDPGNLSDINRKLYTIRISDLIETQPAIVVEQGGKAGLLFREQYVSMAALQKRIAPGVNLFGSRWLFQFLTETLDKRLLAVFARRDFAALKESISLNLNTSTVLTREFQHFHQQVGAHAGKIVVEIQMIDAFSDVDAFRMVRDRLRDGGYRVLIDGLNPLSLQFFDPAPLDADLIKIGWGKEYLSEGPDERMTEMREVVERTGKDRFILSRADSEAAMVWALKLGIHRFQGHYVDGIADSMAAKGML